MDPLTPESFKIFPKDGAQFEALVSQLLAALDYRILEKPALGVDGGRDILVERSLRDVMGERRERVVVQCKHNAHSGKAVGDRELGVWENAMKRHRARGYLLVTDTRPTENLSRSFREYTNDESNFPNWANYWDVDEIISLLNTHTRVRNSFFAFGDVIRTPLDELVKEVRSWLSSIRYEVTEPMANGSQTIDMLATLKQGTICQKILVRCIGRELRSSDVDNLGKALRRKRFQGWLISEKQTSKSARIRAEQAANIEILSLADILRTMIWGSYLQEIKRTVEEEKITSRYVDPACYTMDTNDQGQEVEREVYDSLDEYVDDWINEQGRVHISLLGEFGTGKTWFGLHYAYRQLERFLANPAQERFPLLITLRMFTKATTAQQLINDALLETYALPFIGGAYDVFQQMNSRGKLLLLLDGFDEMAQKVDYQTVVDNFWELATLVNDASKVILTSRTEYFRWARESEKLLAGSASSRGLPLESPRFDVLYIEELDEKRIREVIVRRLGQERGVKVSEEILDTPNLAEMARKPLLIQLLLAALDEVKAQRLRNEAEVYLYATNRLLLRNMSDGKTFVSTADKLYFLCELAWEMLETGELRIHYASIPKRISAYFGPRIKDKHELDVWDYDLRNQTLLHRNAAGYYQFAHKSLAEYFVAFKFACELGCLEAKFARTYTERDGRPCTLPFKIRNFLDLSQTFGAIPLQDRMSTVRDFLSNMVAENSSKIFQELIDSTSGKTIDEVRYVGGNALTLLSGIKESLISRHFEGLILAGSAVRNRDLSNLHINLTNLDGSEFESVALNRIKCRDSSFRDARLSNTPLKNSTIENTDFAGAVIDRWDYIYSLSFSPNGAGLASAGDRNKVAIWDIKSTSETMTMAGSEFSTQDVCFNPQGTAVASGGGDGICRVADALTGLPIWQASTSAAFIRGVMFDPSGRSLASTGDDNALTIWDGTTGEKRLELKLYDEGLCVCFSPNGRFVAVGTRKGAIVIFETKTYGRVKRWRAHEETLFLGFDNKSSLLISGGTKLLRSQTTASINKESRQRGEIKVWEAERWRKVSEFEIEYHDGWMHGSVSPKDPYVAVKSGKANAEIWDYEAKARVLHLTGHYETVYATKFSPDGQSIATCSRDGSIRIWDVATGHLLSVITQYRDCTGATITHPKGLDETYKTWLRERGAVVVD